MKFCVTGLGYIGLPTALLFANKGLEVVGVDIDETLVKELNSGEVYLEEEGLPAILHNVKKRQTFQASISPEIADVFMIAVPTPSKDDEWKSCDLTNVFQALDKVIPLLEPGNTIIIESTIPPKTMENHVEPKINAAGFTAGKDIFIAYCPERVIPGNVVHEFTYNNRIIGGLTSACGEKVANIYRQVVKGEILTTEVKTAEMVKLIENVYRDVNISLANECFKICHQLGINVLDVIKLANKHPRVNIHDPGAGVGGHCIAIDPYFVISQAPATAKLLRLSREINQSMPLFIVEVVRKIMKQNQGRKIAIFGVSYKGNVADTRESPAIEIYNTFKKSGEYELAVYDPYVQMEDVESDLEHVVQDASLILVLTDHNEFRELTSHHFSKMRHQVILDTKHIVEKVVDGMEYIHFGNLHEMI